MSYKKHNFKDGDPLFAAQLNEMDAAIEDLVSRDPSGPISWNDLTDRPFYEESTGAVIEWDGNTEGRDQMMSGGEPQPFYKVSDLTPTDEELGEFIVEINNGVVYTREHLTPMIGENIILTQIFMVFHDTDVTLGGEAASVPSPGIYFLAYTGDTGISKFSYGSTTTIKKLDEKFIPDTIARVGEVSGGLSPTAVALLIDILRCATYTENVTGKIAALEAALASGGNSGGADTPSLPDAPEKPGGTVTEDISVEDGVMTIVSVGSEISTSGGVMTIS